MQVLFYPSVKSQEAPPKIAEPGDGARCCLIFLIYIRGGGREFNSDLRICSPLSPMPRVVLRLATTSERCQHSSKVKEGVKHSSVCADASLKARCLHHAAFRSDFFNYSWRKTPDFVSLNVTQHPPGNVKRCPLALRAPEPHLKGFPSSHPCCRRGLLVSSSSSPPGCSLPSTAPFLPAPRDK